MQFIIQKNATEVDNSRKFGKTNLVLKTTVYIELKRVWCNMMK